MKLKWKRSVLQGLGKLSKFLFGTAAEEDIQGLKGQMAALYGSQTKLQHVVDASIMLLNYTHLQARSLISLLMIPRNSALQLII